MNQTTRLAVLINDLNADLMPSIDGTINQVRSNSAAIFSDLNRIIVDANLLQVASRIVRIETLSISFSNEITSIFNRSFVDALPAYSNLVLEDSVNLARRLNEITQRTGFSPLSAPRLNEIISSSLIRGASLDEYRERTINNFLVATISTIRQSLGRGLTTESISSLVFGDQANNFISSPFIRFIMAITSGYDTYSMDILNRSRMAVYKQSADLLDSDGASNEVTDSSLVPVLSILPVVLGLADELLTGYQHLSVLDEVTSRICTARSGLTWNTDYQPVDHDYPYEVPPLHFNCRSSIIPIINGTAAVGLTTAVFFAALSTDRQDEIFGSRTAELFRNGEIEQQDLLDQLGRPRTLQQAADAS